MRAAAVLAVGLVCALAGAARAQVGAGGGDREVARQHYQNGQARYKANDLHAAILEFAAADAMVPSPILSYDIAVCHDKLGERDQAVARYREYLQRRPDAPNRSDVEQRIAALAPPEPVIPGEPEQPYQAPPPGTVPTRPPDSQDGLARPRSIDEPMAQAEPQRVAYDEPMARLLPGGGQGLALPPGPSRPVAPSAPLPEAPAPKSSSTPFYKQWWFWVFAGVGAIILIDVATSSHGDSTSSNAKAPAGFTLIRF